MLYHKSKSVSMIFNLLFSDEQSVGHVNTNIAPHIKIFHVVRMIQTEHGVLLSTFMTGPSDRL